MKFVTDMFKLILGVLLAGVCAISQDWGVFSLRPVHLYANTIDSKLQLNLVLDSAMDAFKHALSPLALFSTAFYDEPLQGTDKIEIPYYPLETAASKDFDGTYVFNVGTDTQVKELTINKRKYQPLSWTSSERRRQPKLDPEKLGQIKGMKLAEDILIDIWSLFTTGNFGSAAFTGAASTFDVDDVIALEVACNQAHWPHGGRGILTSSSYLGELKKDMNSTGGIATYGVSANGEVINMPGMAGFSFAQTELLPANAINLVGVVVYRSALLVGFNPIEPDPLVREELSDYRVVTDPDTGISLEYRAWGDADTDTAKRTIECNYGRAVGEADAAKLMVSA